MRKASSALAMAALLLGGSAPGLAQGPPLPTSPHPPVVGGNPAAPGRWGDAAAILIEGLAICTGTLIAPDLVLTAGHCFGGITDVRLGAVDLAEPGGEEIAVAREIVYPNSSTTFDVRLLVLERPSAIPPRLVASGCVLDRYLANGAPVAIVGWGAVDGNGETFPDVLMEAETIITDANCTGGRGCRTSVVPGGEMAAGGDSVDSCLGDSGGPLYLLTDIGEYLIGVTSRSYDDALRPCGEGGIYVRADAVMDWVEAQVGQSLPRATCNAAPEPTADRTSLEVTAGDSVSAVVAANDPNAADRHEFAVAEEPSHGQVTTDDDGTVTYAAYGDYAGSDRFAIAVVDSGVPSLSAEVEFQVTVLPGPEDGCGCRAASRDPGTALLAGLIVLLLLGPGRRRRPG